MGSWRDFAARVQPPDPDRANSAISAISSADAGSDAPNGTNGTNGTASLPADLSAGLTRLKTMPAPRGVRPEAWAESVRDAARIVDGGWAALALALGWQPLDLFGGVVEPDGDPYGDGLAVWLSGRKLMALTALGAAAIDANERRHFFALPRGSGARLLWVLGRGR
jgi:hypothetical protein